MQTAAGREAPMPIERTKMYQLPWSLTDNPGGWVEVTDVCDLTCPGCYRHQLTGHVPLAQVEADIITVKRLTNCDRIAIAGGEPLLYPRILEVVEFIARQGLKPLLLTHGERLTLDLARDLRKAGLVKFHFHVDSGMQRHGWSGKNEAELNELRQHFADLVWEAGGMQCGFTITVLRSSLPYLPHVLEWCRSNLHKVQHLSLVAFRAIPLSDEYDYQVGGAPVDARSFQHAATDLDRITVTSDENVRGPAETRPELPRRGLPAGHHRARDEQVPGGDPARLEVAALRLPGSANGGGGPGGAPLVDRPVRGFRAQRQVREEAIPDGGG